MATLVLVHGWGFDHHVWDDVRARLSPAHDVHAIDFGFFGAGSPAPTFGDPVIAVGHSLGACWWLAQAAIPWRRLLVINGFPRFTEGPGYAPAVAPRLLARMQSQFARDPATVLADFHARCGTPSPLHGGDPARLAQGLQWLAEWDGRDTLAQRAADIDVLAATADPIVPAAMTRMAFAALPSGSICWNDAPGHVLPLSQPEACARWIEERLT